MRNCIHLSSHSANIYWTPIYYVGGVELSVGSIKIKAKASVSKGLAESLVYLTFSSWGQEHFGLVTTSPDMCLPPSRYLLHEWLNKDWPSRKDKKVRRHLRSFSVTRGWCISAPRQEGGWLRSLFNWRLHLSWGLIPWSAVFGESCLFFGEGQV